MVRLREDKSSDSKDKLLDFQFQYGAVKRPQDELLFDVVLVFQFQYGAVKRTTL